MANLPSSSPWKQKGVIQKLKVDGTKVGISRSHQYYRHKQLTKHFGINKKRVLRVMKIFGIKPYRRTAKKRFVHKAKGAVIPNLLMVESSQGPGDIYASDFTYIKFQGRWVYVATVIDLYTREIVGVSVLTIHVSQLVMNALSSAVLHRAPPRIIHSEGGSEYKSEDYTKLLAQLGITQSMSAPGCPWENGRQESFYKGFKLDLGDPNRLETVGELVAEIYKTINYYNRKRIHSSLGMSPRQWYTPNSLEKVS